MIQRLKNGTNAVLSVPIIVTQPGFAHNSARHYVSAMLMQDSSGMRMENVFQRKNVRNNRVTQRPKYGQTVETVAQILVAQTCFANKSASPNACVMQQEDTSGTPMENASSGNSVRRRNAIRRRKYGRIAGTVAPTTVTRTSNAEKSAGHDAFAMQKLVIISLTEVAVSRRRTAMFRLKRASSNLLIVNY